MQSQRYLGHLEPGMDVCDIDGNKLGTVNRVYRHEFATAGTEPTPGAVGTLPHDEIIEVKTGLFGLGKHIYVPFSAIQDVTSACVFINQPKDRIEQRGWDSRPDYLDELS